MNDYTIVLISGNEELNYIQGECSAYLGGYRTCDRAGVHSLAGFFLGLYFKTLERALDKGHAKQMRIADIVSPQGQNPIKG